MNFTPDQQKVIDTREKNILVSAAAGSGKTAVLVERILKLILDGDKPLDIDSLLVVTFTRAAAAQMKEKIAKSLRTRLEADPDNAHINRQLTLIHNAQITTIDGFCKFVIDNYGTTIGLESSMRIADEDEIKLMKKDVLSEILEEEFETADPAFISFIETFATNKNETPVESAIERLYAASSGMPYPAKWLDGITESLEKECISVHDTPWMKYLTHEVRAELEYTLEQIDYILELSALPGAPGKYADFFTEEKTRIDEILSKVDDYEYVRSKVRPSFDFKTLPRKSAGDDEAIKNQVTKIRADYKEYFKEQLSGNYYLLPLDMLKECAKKAAAPLKEYVRLTKKFIERFSEKKLSSSILDFSDIEHYALKILVDDEGNRTQAARELSSRFITVMIDEYQDSNYLQEAILTAVSGGSEGNLNNYFCVGDVKQSIYSFRQACPGLFNEKFISYASGDEVSTRIDLHMNFRSRREIIDSVNAIFKSVMVADVGGIDYNEDAYLAFGAGILIPERSPKDPEGLYDFRTEIMPVFTSEEGVTDGPGAPSKLELEARAVGTRILSLMKNNMVYDEEQGVYRRVSFGDIVILLRSMRENADVFEKVLREMDIPVTALRSTGYFSADEVATLVDFLSILSDSHQDIPLASILTSAFVGLEPTELALIKICDTGREKSDFWDHVNAYASRGEDISLKEKLLDFLAFFADVRKRSRYTPLHELIWYIVSKSGYRDYIAALPGGAQKTANINMLIEKAAAYEKSSYVGLFNFIRYINDLKKYEVDYGEAGIPGNEDTVKITTIHKSKGLEYPVVFVSCMSKQFNMRDLTTPILINSDFGVASDVIDFEARTRTPFLKRSVFKDLSSDAAIGEELRVLYVALTRAKQKLIISGTLKDQDALKDMFGRIKPGREKLPLGLIKKAKCCFDFIIPAAARYEDSSFLTFHEISPSDLVRQEIHKSTRDEGLSLALYDVEPEKTYDKELREKLTERFSYIYPYSGQSDLPSKVSVSELKHAALEDGESFQKYEEAPVVPLIPKFMEDREEKLTGAGRGTAYHRFMQLLDYSRIENAFSASGSTAANNPMQDNFGSSREALIHMVKAMKEEFVQKGYMDKAGAAAVNAADIASFLTSPLGLRMKAASSAGTLKRERPFVLSRPASVIDPNYPSGENILIQGIIDAYFFEDGKLILVDYKTDYVNLRDFKYEPAEHPNDTELAKEKDAGQELIEKYKVQLESYADALSSLLGVPVAEKHIYSFSLAADIIL